LASRASSDLLIKSDSLIFFNEFFVIKCMHWFEIN
jgi:hypothetical protein